METVNQQTDPDDQFVIVDVDQDVSGLDWSSAVLTIDGMASDAGPDTVGFNGGDKPTFEAAAWASVDLEGETWVLTGAPAGVTPLTGTVGPPI